MVIVHNQRKIRFETIFPLIIESAEEIGRKEVAEAYMIFGGIPYYLSYWDGRYGLPQNVDRIVFYEDAPLRDEFENLYASLFAHSELYIEAIDALGKKGIGLTREELVSALSVKDDGIVNLCEIKFSKYEYDVKNDYEENLRNKVFAFGSETHTRKTPHLTLVSTYGAKQNGHARVFQSQVVLDDLFAPPFR